jgi:hypothetical protein
VAGEGVLELRNAVLQADDLLPEPITLSREFDNTFRQLGDVVMPTEGFAALPLDGTVGAHPLRVGGPFPRPPDTMLSRMSPASHARIYIDTLAHSHLRFVNVAIIGAVRPGSLPGLVNARVIDRRKIVGE